MPEQGNHKILGISSAEFEPLALAIFREQCRMNAVYGEFIRTLGVDPVAVRSITQIPFLPVRFFKSRAVQTGDFKPAAIFESSGTTGMVSSRHLVKDLSVYEESFTRGFELVYGPVSRYCLLGLLPSYLERGHSSLVYMVDQLVKKSGHPQSGFYAGDYAKLYKVLRQLEQDGQATLLIGVTYALLDFAAQYSLPLKHTILMETGGMKGRREEMIRPEVHALLQKSFSVDAVHSEYGMTELLSQAYSTGSGVFRCPPWMKVLVRDEEDPFRVLETGSGIINIIDLANLHSCAFIATDDAGKCRADGSFEVLGRVDGSDLRGCSLLLV
ncbi:MAG: acyl transferase [Sphingobacteriales bacterium]|nr:acyl transferase [Sphingobacteriales bacterium]